MASFDKTALDRITLAETTQVCRLNWNVGVVTFFGADVVKLAGLQQACISEVLLIDGITAFCVQVLHDESFWLSCGALVILAVGSPTLGATAYSAVTLLAHSNDAWLIGSLIGPNGAAIFKHSMPSASSFGMQWLIETAEVNESWWLVTDKPERPQLA